MITENTRKQLADYRKRGKKLKYLINYLMGLVVDEDDFERIILREMKALAFNEDEIVECLEYNFGLDMSWHPMSVNYKKEEKIMEQYIKEIEQIAAKCTESQSDGYSQIMRICDAIREEQKYCLGCISKEEIASPQFG